MQEGTVIFSIAHMTIWDVFMWEMIFPISLGIAALTVVAIIKRINWVMSALTLTGLATIVTLAHFAFVATSFFPAQNALKKGQGRLVVATFNGQAPDIEPSFSASYSDRRPVFDGKAYGLPGDMLGEMKYGEDVIDRLRPGRTYELLVYKERILQISGPVQ